MPISLSGSLVLTGSLTTTSTITAQTLVVQTITSSISSITGSTNFGSLSSNTHTFTGSLNVTGALYVTTGNVGIGTTSPSQKLEVVGGEIKAGRVDTNQEGGQVSFGRASDNNTTWYIDAYGSSTSPQLRFVDVDNSSVRMVLTGSNVGIGTTSPSYTLDVTGTGRFTSTLTTNGFYANAGNSARFYRGANDYYWSINSDSSNYLNFGTYLSNGTAYGTNPKLILLDSGNVGIGTTSPGFQLDVQNSSSPSIRVRNAANGGTSTLLLETANDFSGTCQTYVRCIGSAGNGQSILTFGTAGATGDATATERMRITSGGQVLIGSTASLYTNVKLSVKQTAVNIPAEIWSSYSGDSGSGALMLIKFDNSSSTSQVFQRFVIDNGNTACGQINGNGASQVAFGSWSDSRLKDNIENLPSQLSNIMALRPVEFDYKNGSGHQIGFIAQEMQEVYPDAVGEDTDGFLTITGWSKTEARLVKAIQELKAENDSLKSRIEILENK